MTRIEKTVKHTIGKEKALERIKQLLPKLKSQFGHSIKNLNEEWKSYKCTFSFDYKLPFFITEHISGEIMVQDDEVIIKGAGSDFISPFKKKIEDILGSEGEKLLK